MSKLMTTSAVLLLAATPILAENSVDGAVTAAAETAQDAIGASVTEFGDKMQAWTKPAVDVDGYLPMVAGSIAAEALYGAPVVDATAAASTDQIGEVSDLILNADGKVAQAVISVGGFLGIGATDVTVMVDEVQIMRALDDPSDVIVVVDAETVEARAELKG